MISSKHTLSSIVPSHILEEYPRFVEFLEAYYEWLNKEGNPYASIKNHLDYLSFEKSMDSYVDHMKQEYLVDVPEIVLLDKELFIKWSKKFNLARGSHASYKFLFRLLFNEQDTEIYTPKENILRTSDGTWISGESLMLVTNSGNQNQFQFQRIFQKRQVYLDIYEYAYATVQRVRTKYVGRYSLTELALSDIEGEFLPDYPIETETGGSEWIVPTTERVEITNQGANYQVGERVLLDGVNDYVITRTADSSGSFDTRVTSFFNDLDITLTVNGNQVNDFSFDGRTVNSTTINPGDVVTVTMPSYGGYLVVNETDNEGGIVYIDILDLPIGTTESYSVTVDGIGSGAAGTSYPGLIKPVEGYYEDTKGHLSSNMYLQDSYFYQDYSYSIKTQQDFTNYADMVKKLLHPAGFLMFGQIAVIALIEILIGVKRLEDRVESAFNDQSIIPKYSLGPNYSFYRKMKKLDRHLYTPEYWIGHDMEMVYGVEGYNLEDSSLARLKEYNYRTKLYIEEGYYGTGYYDNGDVVLKGWMTKDNLVDYHLHIPHDYIDHHDSGMMYFEDGYMSTRTA